MYKVRESKLYMKFNLNTAPMNLLEYEMLYMYKESVYSIVIKETRSKIKANFQMQQQKN